MDRDLCRAVPGLGRTQHQPRRQLAAAGCRPDPSDHLRRMTMTDAAHAVRTRAVADTTAPPENPALARVENLRITFDRDAGDSVSPVEDVSFEVRPGERLAVVGESGSGKSLTSLALMGLVDRVGGRIADHSQVEVLGVDMVRAPEPARRALRGGGIGMIFQDPLTSLDPVRSVGFQLGEAIELHRPALDKHETGKLAVDLLDQVRLPRPQALLASYPHELSGGMRQRVMIAIALAGDPDLLIADEPTTALDVTVQAQILDLVHDLCDERSLAVVLVTHDLGVVAGFADRVVTMYAGRIVEQGATEEVYAAPRHPYTDALMRSIPPLTHREPRLVAIPGSPPEPAHRPTGCAFHDRCGFAEEHVCTTERPPLTLVEGSSDARRVACLRLTEITFPLGAARATERAESTGPAGAADGSPLVSVRGLTKKFAIRSGGFGKREQLTAVDDVSLDIGRAEILGIVGESGSGKSTLARCLLRLIDPTSGRIEFDGRDLASMSARELRKQRPRMQMIFQDPSSSLNPRMTVRQTLLEPLKIHGRPADEQTLVGLLDSVKLPASALARYPHEFSGGQRQRIAIARAIALRPELLVCDEPVSALDVSVRSSLLNVLSDLRAEQGISLVFIAHDLAMVRFLCDRVGVMFRSRLVELNGNPEIYDAPVHPHTRALLAAQPIPDPDVERRRRTMRRDLLNEAGDPSTEGTRNVESA
ncbi:dipeptide ABC transporter ATP-binding protein [Pseudonocardia sulfidoxydans]|uniref:dipeptide ABC transporter ATP-binding protein n=1 Tax=Pseudonocardia sulfidoxydans TaxID=54011 RepID=UPI003605D0D8